MMQPAAGVCTEPIPAKQSITLIDRSMRGTSHSTVIDLDPQVFAFWKSNGNGWKDNGNVGRNLMIVVDVLWSDPVRDLDRSKE